MLTLSLAHTHHVSGETGSERTPAPDETEVEVHGKRGVRAGSGLEGGARTHSGTEREGTRRGVHDDKRAGTRRDTGIRGVGPKSRPVRREKAASCRNPLRPERFECALSNSEATDVAPSPFSDGVNGRLGSGGNKYTSDGPPGHPGKRASRPSPSRVSPETWCVRAPATHAYPRLRSPASASRSSQTRTVESRDGTGQETGPEENSEPKSGTGARRMPGHQLDDPPFEENGLTAGQSPDYGDFHRKRGVLDPVRRPFVRSR